MYNTGIITDVCGIYREQTDITVEMFYTILHSLIHGFFNSDINGFCKSLHWDPVAKFVPARFRRHSICVAKSTCR